MKVKICGITSVEDALVAADLGADAIGLNFYPKSKRFLDVKTARSIVERLPPLVWVVGVFVNASARTMGQVAKSVGLHAVQLHGDEKARLASTLSLPTFKAVHVGDRLPSLRGVKAFSGLVLDATQEGYGGGGKAFDWSLAREIAEKHSVLLAGGLTPSNVRAAIRAVRPWGVDVATGVEVEPRKKDPRKVAAFIKAARREVS